MKQILILLLTLSVTWPLYPQISPGKLAAPHANLEGIRNCTQCHTLGSGPDAEKCMKCHKEIKHFLDRQTGFHFKVFSQENKSCFECHSEHNGKKFRLIFWKNGKDNFDHNQTGYILQGKHAQVKCEKCHQPKNIKTDLGGLNKDINLDKTHLGLSQKCSSCHFDEHRGQLSTDCQSCHNFNGWRPAAKFDHNRVKFTLTGKHISVDCKKCHADVKTPRKSPETEKFTTPRFTGLNFQNCTACHKDVHRSKFGTDCQKCHVTTGWQVTNKNKFNHSLTRFPLLGLHQNVNCIKCHTGNKMTTQSKFALCKDCHRDVHQSQFSARADKGRCESCHDVFGFSPARFGMIDHSKTDYPLTGAHFAVPCQSCHIKDRSGLQIFKFKNKTCNGCHKDIHQGQFASYVTRGGCESCHKTDSWHKTSFEHASTRFPLQGKHAQIQCSECHVKVNEGRPGEYVSYKLKSFECTACHQDIHLGQFTQKNKQADCRKCHKSNSWFDLIFEHNVHSSFIIIGAHKEVTCGECHRQETRNDKQFIRFKPLAHQCKSCHFNKTGGKL